MKMFIFRESEITDLNPIVAKERGLGATETCFIELANSLAKNHKVVVCCPCKEHKVYNGVEYIPFQNYVQATININVFEPDAIIVVGNPRILFNNSFNQKVVFWQHNHPDEVKHFPIQSLLDRENLKIVFPSPEAAEVGISKYENREKILGIYNGVRLEIFSKQNEKIKDKIVFCGSLTRAKGVLNLLNHCFELSKYKIHICSGFDLYGNVDKPYMESCLPLIEANENVTLTGALKPDELADQLSTAELCIVNPVPGHKETCCVSALESMAVGTPVLSGDSSINTIISRGGSFFQVSTSIAAAISKIMNNEQERKELADSGRNWVSKLSWDRISKEWEEL